jgi:F-type H+-transporting ATPase subunit epsilon
MKLELITPVGIKLSQEVYEVVLPTHTGLITILPGHEPLITLLKHGVMSVRSSQNDSEPEHLAVDKGIVEINGQTVRILANEAATGGEIVEDEVKNALAAAQKMSAEAKSQVELEEAKNLVERQIVKLKVAELHRHHRRQRMKIN